MTRLLTTITVLLAFFVPAALAAPPETGPAKQCKQLRASMSAADFASAMNATANPKSAFGKCVAQRTQQVTQSTANAAKACKAEMADAGFGASHGNKSFAEWYGQNKNDRNAYGKCVSAKAKAAAEAQQQAVLNAAKACKAERASWNPADHQGKSFAESYGTNTNKRNAFGKCVSKLAKQQ